MVTSIRTMDDFSLLFLIIDYRKGLLLFKQKIFKSAFSSRKVYSREHRDRVGVGIVSHHRKNPSEYSQRNHSFLMILQISCLLANTFSLIQFHLTISLDFAIFR